MNYNFSELDDKEFELLVNDLLGKKYNLKVDRFKSGKDGGIDGRFEYKNNKIAIIQTKQYLGSGYKQLVYKLKNEELKKIVKLFDEKKLTKYIFTTDLPLSKANKEEIKEIFEPYIKSIEDIFGNENLNELLSENADIEKKYYRLWIKSTNVLNNILNNAILGRSKFSFEEIIEKSKMFVEIKSFYEALKKIEKDRVIIIVGEPGIGKSTLSENLCLRLVSKYEKNFDYEFIDMKEGIKEAEEVWNIDKKQLYYYDDFLGSNYFEAITDNKDSHIMQFIKRVNKSKNKIFILNSRTNILNYGKEYSNKFQIENISKNEFILNINDLTQLEKANILYKHIVHSDLPINYINKIYEKKNYYKIINHKNFNPRIIDFITSNDRINIEAEDYFSYIEGTLTNPKDIWQNAFDVQANDYIRNLVSLVVYNGGNITEKKLIESYNDICKNITNTSHTSKDFNSIINLSTKSFLNKNINENTKAVTYSLFNPSISDFVLHKYEKNTDKILEVINGLNTVESLRKIYSIHYRNDNVYIEVLEKLLSPKNLKEKDNNYIFYLINLVSEKNIGEKIILRYLQLFIDNYTKLAGDICLSTILLLNKYSKDLIINTPNFLIEHFEYLYLYLNEESINNIGQYINKLNNSFNLKSDSDLLKSFQGTIEYFLIERVKEDLNQIDLKKFITYENSDINYDECEIEKEIKKGIDNIIIDINNIECVLLMKIDSNQIFSDSYANISDLVNEYIENENLDNEDLSSNSNKINYLEDIDILFKRD